MTDRDPPDSLAPDDDWFAEAPAGSAERAEPVHQAPAPEPEPAPSARGDRPRKLGIIGLVAVLVALLGAVLAWALDGSGDPQVVTTTTTITETETTTVPTTPTTAPEETTPTTTEPAPPVAPATVRQGDSGETVRAVQQALADLGYDVVVDGNFGEQTATAVVAFQTASGLEPDGLVGPATYAALEQAAPG